MTNQIIYATRRVPNSEGRIVKNPRHFQKPLEGATKVFIDGHWPKVEEAYTAAGVPVGDVSEMRALPRKAKAEKAPDEASTAE